MNKTLVKVSVDPEWPKDLSERGYSEDINEGSLRFGLLFIPLALGYDDH